MFDENDADFVLTKPEDLRAALFELTHPDSHTLVRDPADREIAVLILGVDMQSRHFFWRPRDFDGADFEGDDSMGLLAGTSFQFRGTAYGGIQIRLRVARPEIIHFEDGSAALASPFPESLSRIQRRKMFRAPLTKIAKPYRGVWRPAPNAAAQVFTLRDLSVEGAGLRIGLAVSALPQVGAILEDVVFDFDELGNLTTDVEVRNAYAVSGQSTPSAEPQAEQPQDNQAPALGLYSGEPPVSHLGVAFRNLDARQENRLQQLVWQLERSRPRD